MEDNTFALLLQQKQGNEMERLVSCNEVTGAFGLSLSQEDAKELMKCHQESLRSYGRVEFGESLLPQLVRQFCDSPYLSQEGYLETMEELQDIFYQFKGEMMEEVSDDELMTFMKEQFDGVCFGDTDYLASTCLERFSKAVRAGYRDFRGSGGRGEYGQLSEEQRWDRELYLEVLRELCW